MAVVKKKKKTMLGKLLSKLRTASSSHNPIDSCIPFIFNDDAVDRDTATAIASRRTDIRNAKHDNTDAMVIFDISRDQ